MNANPPSGRARLVLAIVVSLTLHGLAGYAWLAARVKSPAAQAGSPSLVDSPDEKELTITMREPLKAKPRVLPPAVQPLPLPPEVVTLPPQGPGAIQPVGASPSAPESSPKPGGPKPLHGELKAGRTIVYVLDRSSSMGIDCLLTRATAALRASLNQLGPDVRFQIVAYNGGTTTFAPQPVAATPEAIEGAGRWLAGLFAEGGSNHRAGFKEAFAAQADLVFLLTDADDLDGPDVQAIARMNRKPARVMAAVFGGVRPVRETPLERLVTLTGGTIQYVRP
jgi:hypothetical protein